MYSETLIIKHDFRIVFSSILGTCSIPITFGISAVFCVKLGKKCMTAIKQVIKNKWAQTILDGDFNHLNTDLCATS